MTLGVDLEAPGVVCSSPALCGVECTACYGMKGGESRGGRGWTYDDSPGLTDDGQHLPKVTMVGGGEWAVLGERDGVGWLYSERGE